MSAAKRHMLVFGASGIVGGATLDLFSRQPGWAVTGVSRRKPDPSSFSDPSAHFDHLSVDLRDATSCQQLHSLSSVTHVVYAALYETAGLWAGWYDEAVMEVNRQMLENAMAGLIAAKAPLEHVTVIHGRAAHNHFTACTCSVWGGSPLTLAVYGCHRVAVSQVVSRMGCCTGGSTFPSRCESATLTGRTRASTGCRRR